MWNGLTYYKFGCTFSNEQMFLNDISDSYIETVTKMLNFYRNVDFSGRCQRGEKIYKENKLFNIEVKELISYIPLHKSNNFDERQDLLFKCKCSGTDGKIYDIEIIIDKGWCILYTDCACPDYEKEPKICKHIFAALYWLKENLYTLTNIEVVSGGDLGYIDCRFNGFSKKEYVVSTYKTLTKYIDSYEITKLRLYEKACRYLDRGLKSACDKFSPWTDKDLPTKFDKIGYDFNEYMKNFLENDAMHNLGPQEDEWVIEHCFRLPYRKFTYLRDRIDNISTSIAINPFGVVNTEDFDRIIKTYKEIKNVSIEGENIDAKEIVIPGAFKLIVFDIQKINKKHYEALKIKYGEEPFYYKANKNIYMSFKINM